MPVTFKPLPPDHLLFSGDVSFVFRHELPEDETEQDESESDTDPGDEPTPA
jgi:hypothetical protein